MKPFLCLALLSSAFPAFAMPKPADKKASNGAPAWLQQELKPIVKRPVVTR